MPSQGIWIEVMKRDAKNVNQKFDHDNGVCSGVALRFIYFASIGRLDLFKDQMRLLTNNDPAQLTQRLQLGHDISVCQDPTAHGLAFTQSDHTLILNLLADSEKHPKVPLNQLDYQHVPSVYQQLRHIAFPLTRAQLIYVLRECVVEDQYVMVGASQHAGGFFLKNGIYYCFEPNFGDDSKEGMNIIAHDSIEKLVSEMLEQGFFHNFYGGKENYFADYGDTFFAEFSIYEDSRHPSKAKAQAKTVDVIKASGAWAAFQPNARFMHAKRTLIQEVLTVHIRYETFVALFNDNLFGELTANDAFEYLGYCEDKRVFDFLLTKMDLSNPAIFADFVATAAVSAQFTQSALALQIYINWVNALSIEHTHFYNLISKLVTVEVKSGLVRCLDLLAPLSKKANIDQSHNQLNQSVIEIFKATFATEDGSRIEDLISKWPQVHGLFLGEETLKLFSACCSGKGNIDLAGNICREYLEMALEMASRFGNTRAMLKLHHPLHCPDIKNPKPFSDEHINLMLRSGNDDDIAQLLSESDLIPLNWHDKAGNNLIHLFSRFGLVKSLKQYIELNKATPSADINEKNQAGFTPLMNAARNGYYSAALILLAHPCSVIDVEPKFEYTALHFIASGLGEVAPEKEVKLCKNVIEKILAASEKMLNVKNKSGNTAFHLACRSGHADIVKLLLDQPKEELYLTNNNDDNALHIAVRAGRQDLVDVLLAHERTSPKYPQAKLPTLRNKQRRTPFHMACELGDEVMVNRIRQYWAGPVNDGIFTVSPMLPLSSACWNESIALTTDLVQTWGESVEGVEKLQKPAFAAIAVGNLPIIKMLIEQNKASVAWKASNIANNMFIYRAVKCGKLRLLELLLMNLSKPASEKPSDSEELRAEKQTHLTNWHQDIVQALELAWERRRYDMMRSIMSYDTINVDQLLNTAVEKGDATVLEILLMSSNYDLSKADEQGNTMLHRACISLSMDVIQLLCNAGNNTAANKDIFSLRNKSIKQNQLGKTALDIIDTKLNIEKAKGKLADVTIISKCEKIKAVFGAARNPIKPIQLKSLLTPVEVSNTNRGLTALHLAAVNNDKPALAIILARGDAPLDVADQRGNTPLHIAAMLNNTEVMKFLIKSGASLQFKNDEGLSVADFAVRYNNSDILKALNISPLHAALYANDAEKIKELLFAGHYTDVADDNGQTPLMIAKQRCSPIIISMLQNAKGNSPVHLAILLNDHDTLKQLLNKGTSIVMVNNDGDLPIQLARKIGNTAGVSLLQQHIQQKEKLVGDYHNPLELVEVSSYLPTHTPGRLAIARLAASLLPNFRFLNKDNVQTDLLGDHRGLRIIFGSDNAVYAERLSTRLKLHYGFNYCRANNDAFYIDCHKNASEQEVNAVHLEIGMFIFDICNTKLFSRTKNFSYLRDLYCDQSGNESGVKIADQSQVEKLRDRFEKVHSQHKGSGPSLIKSFYRNLNSAKTSSEDDDNDDKIVPQKILPQDTSRRPPSPNK